jgi:hypothetical protein
MILRAFMGLLLAFCLTSCIDSGDSSQVRIDTYFDLVGLLDEQSVLLYKNRAVLRKKLTANGTDEILTIKPDSVGQIKAELRLFYEADINKLGLGDAYVIEELPGVNGARKVINTARASGAKVRLIEYDYQNDQLERIRVLIEEKTGIYTFEKEMLLNFGFYGNSELLESYMITGKQQMVMKSDLNFSLEGVFSVQP